MHMDKSIVTPKDAESEHKFLGGVELDS